MKEREEENEKLEKIFCDSLNFKKKTVKFLRRND